MKSPALCPSPSPSLSLPLFQASKTSATLRLCGAIIDLQRLPERTEDNRDAFAYVITLPDGSEHAGRDLFSGCGGSSFREAARSLLSFLYACAESRAGALRWGRCENSELFPEAVGEWAFMNSDEIAMCSEEI